MINEPIHVTDETFEKAVLKSELPVVVDFWAPWCGPCKMMAPLLDQAAKDYAGKLIVAKVNIDDDSETAESLGVQSIPSLFYIRNGQIVNKTVGSMPAATLDEHIQELLA
jgi:thioredoxin 1